MDSEPGRWEGPDDFVALYAVRPEVDKTTAAAVLDDLARGGLLVTTRYYVPSPAELYDMYGGIGRDLYRGMRGNLRWVMCRETHDALWRRHRDQRAAVPPDIRRLWSLGMEWAEPETVAVVDVDFRTQFAYLFGIPIRIDPAARSPLLEIDSEATLRR